METVTLNKSQNSWAEYSALPPPSIQLRRHDDARGTRFYYYTVPEEGEFKVKTAVGITSLLAMTLPTSPFMVQWKLDNPDHEEILDNSSAFGTLLHMIFTEWLVNKNIPKEYIEAARDIAVKAGQGYDMIDKDILSFMKFVEDFNVTPILCEAILLSPPVQGEHYALTLDLFCELDVEETRIEVVEDGVWQRGEKKGQPKIIENKIKEMVRKTALIDYKSNFLEKESKQFYDSHKYQLLAAKRAMKHNYDIDVDLVANFAPNSWRTVPSYSLKFWEFSDIDNALFDHYIDIARLKGFFVPSGRIFVAPEFVEGAKSSDYKFLSYQEYAEQELLGEQISEVTSSDE